LKESKHKVSTNANKIESDLTVVIVSYNSGKYLKRCLNSLLESNFMLEVILVDNNSSDETVLEVQRQFPTIKIIQNLRNHGFAKACNQALQICKTDYVLFLNPDVTASDSSIKNLLEFLQSKPEVGLASGKLLNVDRSLQYSIRNFPTVLNQLFECFFLHHIFPGLSKKFGEVIYAKDFYEKAREVDWVSGAVMLARRNALEEIGYFDERYFLYSEETDLCLRLKKSGWKIYYYPEAVFVHLESATKHNPQLFAYWLDSRLKYYKKNFSKPKVLLLSSILFLNWLLRLSLSLGGALFSPKKLEEFRARLSGVSIFWREIWAI